MRQYKKQRCKYCNQLRTVGFIKRHELACPLNPKNIKYCVCCGKAITSMYNTTTCSYACSNTHFRSGPDNPNWKESCYTTTCFHHHEHKCIICGETIIVEVHHFDCDKNNNKPDNLIPMCPTHHQYMHSRFRKLIDKQVVEYRKNFLMGK